MIAPPIPPNEQDRLDALWRVAILDTGPEDFFEDLVDLAQSLVPAPIALVSLVDERRQWFKAKRGMDASEMPRNSSICGHAILSDAPLVAGDLRRDPRFRNNPVVTGAPGLLAYAGAPIVLAGGSRIGTVCVLDTAPRDWTRVEVDHLQRCARMVSRHIESRRARLEQDRQTFLELALTRAETRYQSVLESMSEGMVVHGPSGAIIDSNPAAWVILGMSRDQLFGRASLDPRWRAIRPTGEAFPGEEHPAMVTLRTGEPQHGVVMGVVTPDGERRWLSVNSYPVRRAQDGVVDQVVAVFRQRRSGSVPVNDA